MAITVRPVEKDEWQVLARTFGDFRYQQLWEFGIASADRLNARSEHVAVCDGTEMIALADVRIKLIPFVNTGIAYVNGGPMVGLSDDILKRRERFRIALSGLGDHYVKTRKLVLRIQPPLGEPEWNETQRDVFRGLGFDVCGNIRPYRTMVLSLSQPLEDIRKQLDQKWRNCLNSSEKKGLAVRAGTEDALFEDFLALYTELKQRKDFHVDLDPGFYRNVQDGLHGSDRFWLTLIYQDGQPLAGHVASVLGDTCIYLLGATSASGLKNNAAYLAQWSVVKMAKEKGCLWYDLGGIDPEGNKGVYHFKKGMGGMDISAANPSELSPGILRRSLVSTGEKVFGVIKKVAKR